MISFQAISEFMVAMTKNGTTIVTSESNKANSFTAFTHLFKVTQRFGLSEVELVLFSLLPSIRECSRPEVHRKCEYRIRESMTKKKKCFFIEVLDDLLCFGTFLKG
jgi:hypothetical protein